MNRYSSSLKNPIILLLLLLGTLISAACKTSNLNNEGPKQRGYMVHGFEEVRSCIPAGNQEYAWLLTTEYSRHLAPQSVYLAGQYGNILPEKKPLSTGEKITEIWAIPGVPYQLWAATTNKLFLIDVPHNNGPLVDQTTFKPIFSGQADETISIVKPIRNSRSAWLRTDRSPVSSIGGGLYFVDADDSTPVRNIPFPQVASLMGVFPAPEGHSAWSTWIRQIGSMAFLGTAVFFENKDGTVSAKEPIRLDTKVSGIVPIKDGTLAWGIHKEPLSGNYYSGQNPQLLSSYGQSWSLKDFLFDGAKVRYAVSENAGDELRMWAWVETKPGIYLIEATNEGPKRQRQFTEDVLPKSIVPSADGKWAWVVGENSGVYRLGIDGSVHKFDLTLGPPAMQPGLIAPSPNGQKAWLIAGPAKVATQENNREPLSLFFLDQQSGDKPQKIPLMSQPWTILPTPDNQHAFVVDKVDPLSGRTIKEVKFYVLNDGKVEHAGEPVLKFLETTVTPLPQSYSPVWAADGKNGCWVLRWDQGAMASVSLSFNNSATLSYDEAHKEDQQEARTLSAGTKIENATVQLSLQGQRSPEDYGGYVQLSFLDGKSGETLYKTPDVKLGDSKQIQINWSPSPNYPYKIDLTFRDEFGTKSSIQWPRVQFAVPWLQRPWVRTVIAFLIVCVLSALPLFFLKPTKSRIRGWLPLMVIILGSASSFLEQFSAAGIDASIFTTLVAVSAVGLMGLALVSSTIFRSLAQIGPFDLFIPYLSLLPFMRRKIFSPYATWLRDQLRLARERANFEVYTAIPATIEGANEQKRRVGDPAGQILNFLSNASNPKPQILIEAAGGTGKSALLREVVDQSLVSFLRDPKLPLPILCEGGEGSLDEVAQRALGKYALSPKLLASQINDGHFFLVIDGPQESRISSEQIRKWIKSESAETGVLFIASRPNDAVSEAVQLADKWYVVTPERLTDETLDVFEDTYIKGNSNPNHVPEKLTDKVKELCRGSDKTYLPILVRLALLVGSQNPKSIADIYEDTFQLLLRAESNGHSGLLDNASALCVETYWENGQRALRYKTAHESRLQIMRPLKDAGVLVPSDKVVSLVGEPREVRFFHDSMQSYLTSRGLLNRNSEWAKALPRAAGDPMFRESQQAGDLQSSSELFRMCLQVFEPETELRGALKSDLLHWASAYDRKLTRDDVEQPLPPSVQNELSQRVAPESGAGTVLREVVDLLLASSDPGALQQLGGLYARIAERVWVLERDKEKHDLGSQAPIPAEQTPA